MADLKQAVERKLCQYQEHNRSLLCSINRQVTLGLLFGREVDKEARLQDEEGIMHVFV